eukprot:Rhum_TRINITY_DN2936_c0_g1::Rhum_TRINITY_DN2936_c0_g1_i1::g.8981::m.8981
MTFSFSATTHAALCAFAFAAASVGCAAGSVTIERHYTQVDPAYYAVYSEGVGRSVDGRGQVPVLASRSSRGDASPAGVYTYAANYTHLDAAFGGYQGYRARHLRAYPPLPAARLAGQASCPATRSGGSVAGKTELWVASTVQVAASRPGLYHPAALEVDVFREVAWRTPCVRPTEVLLTHRCNVPETHPGNVADLLQSTGYCVVVGAYEPPPTASVQQEDGKTIIRFLVGATGKEAVEAVRSAVEEVVADVNSPFGRHYGTVDLQQATVVEYPQFPERVEEGAGSAILPLQAILVLAIGLPLVAAASLAFWYCKKRWLRQRNVALGAEAAGCGVPAHGVVPGGGVPSRASTSTAGTTTTSGDSVTCAALSAQRSQMVAVAPVYNAALGNSGRKGQPAFLQPVPSAPTPCAPTSCDVMSV